MYTAMLGSTGRRHFTRKRKASTVSYVYVVVIIEVAIRNNGILRLQNTAKPLYKLVPVWSISPFSKHHQVEIMSHKFSFSIFALYAVVGICSSSSGPEVQTCGNSGYYCTVTNQCLPRAERCVGSGNCLNHNGIEDGCDCDNSYQRCNVYFGRTDISSSGSSSKKRNVGIGCAKFLLPSNREHHFIQYKGFTWEFGKTYLTQTLDVNDPNYKYDRPRERGLIRGVTLKGTSSCTYDQVVTFTNNFDHRYCTCSNNCQHFAKGLQEWLLRDCTHPFYRGKRQTNDSLSEYFAMISQAECNEGIVRSYS